MSLRRKTLLFISLTLVGLLVLLYVASRIILLNSFTQLEEQRVRDDTQRVLNAISDELSSLDTITSDWSNWDDSYAFVQDGNQQFVTANLDISALADLKVNLVVFIDLTGKQVFSQALDWRTKQAAPLPNDLDKLLSPQSVLLNYTNDQTPVMGVVLAGGEPMLVVSRPSLNGRKQGPRHGSVMFGRYLNDAAIGDLSAEVRQSVTAYTVNDPKLPADFTAARSALAAVASSAAGQQSIMVQPLSVDTIAGYASIKDIYGSPVLMLRTDMPRDILKQGEASLSYFLGSLLIAGLAFGVAMTLLMERVVLARLADLSKNVRAIRASGGITGRLVVTGKDELSSLGTSINEMLETLDQSQKAVAESNQRLLAIVNHAPIAIWVLDATGKLVLLDGEAFKALGIKTQTLIGQTIYEMSKALPQLEEGNRRALSGELFDTIIRVAGRKFESHYMPLKDAGGTVISVLGVATDITTLDQTRSRLEHRNQQLERTTRFFSALSEQLVVMVKRGAHQSELLECLSNAQTEINDLDR